MVEIDELLAWLKENNFVYDVQKLYKSKHFITEPKDNKVAFKSHISFSKTNSTSKAGVIFCLKKNKAENAIIKVSTPNPRLDFIKCIHHFFKPKNCKVIKGKNIKIGKNCTIGGKGFGFEKDETGKWIRFPHYGNIIIEDNVEIGDNCTINRGTLNNTIISKGVKIDCGVHIAHNCIVGENSIITGHVMLSGGVNIGKNCWLGPNSTVLNKIKIGENVMVGIGSNVIKNVPPNSVIFGNPARIVRKNLK